MNTVSGMSKIIYLTSESGEVVPISDHSADNYISKHPGKWVKSSTPPKKKAPAKTGARMVNSRDPDGGGVPVQKLSSKPAKQKEPKSQSGKDGGSKSEG